MRRVSRRRKERQAMVRLYGGIRTLMKQEYKKRLLCGRCIRCGSPRPRGRVQCDRCQTKMLLRIARLRQQRREAGLCLRCGGAKEEGSVYCAAHRQAHEESRRRAREKSALIGKCRDCSNPSNRFIQCLKCRQRMSRQRKAKRRSSNGENQMHERSKRTSD